MRMVFCNNSLSQACLGKVWPWGDEQYAFNHIVHFKSLTFQLPGILNFHSPTINSTFFVSCGYKCDFSILID